MKPHRILVVDDEPNMQRVLQIMLQKMGHEVVCAPDGAVALERLHEAPADLVISDLRMPGVGGIDLLRALRGQGSDVPLIIMTAHGTIESAVDAMKLGACEYIVRPFDLDALEVTVERILSLGRVTRENRFLRDEVDKGWGEFVGQSPAMQKVYELIRQVAPGKTTVLISGETGTGKELVARAIHRASPRPESLFVPINCAAIPAEILESELFGYEKGAFTGANKTRVGKFEMADGGTLFLDELTEMPMALQAKLLRVLQEGVIERLGGSRPIKVDLRVVAATNRNPREAVSEGRLREDLYYRLNVFNIDVPPLRERKEDIPGLVERFLAMSPGAGALTPAAMACLQGYDWPGNVRELQNVIERAAVLGQGKPIDTEFLPAEMTQRSSAVRAAMPVELPSSLEITPALESLEEAMIRAALKQTGDNKTRAARVLDISERSLWYKLKKYGLG
jgi:two-component system, NtrC family, response regulator AtoC